MKKFIRFMFWAGISVVIIKIVKAFYKTKSYSKVVIFGGINKKFKAIELTDKSYAIIFGGINLDLREVTLPETGITIKVYSRFGGINIKVPKSWNVKTEGKAEKSNINNSTEYISQNDSVPQLKISYDLKFSGLNIAFPKTENGPTENHEQTD